jgi:hypothetical protein
MASASATLTSWSSEVAVHNTTAAQITVIATNCGSTVETVIQAGQSSFVGVVGQRPDAFNLPGHGGFDSGQGLGDGYGQTVQTMSGGATGLAMPTVTATGTVASATLQGDGSVLVA